MKTTYREIGKGAYLWKSVIMGLSALLIKYTLP